MYMIAIECLTWLIKNHFLVSSPDNADAILINTCHIREKAAEKVYSEIGKYSDLKDNKRN